MVRSRVPRALNRQVPFGLLLMLVAAAIVVAVLVPWSQSQSHRSELEPVPSGAAKMVQRSFVSPSLAVARAPEGGPVATLADVAAAATRSMVTVTSSRIERREDNPFLNGPIFRHFFGPGQEVPRERREHGLGSGALMSKEGVILTNSHRPAVSWPRRPPASAFSESYGMDLTPLTAALSRRLGLPETIEKGVVITEVAPGSPAAEAGLERGDVILQVDEQEVRQPRDVLRRLEQKKQAVAVLVWRHGDTPYSVLKPSARR